MVGDVLGSAAVPGGIPAGVPSSAVRPSGAAETVRGSGRTGSFGLLPTLLAILAMCAAFLLHRRVRPVLGAVIRPSRRPGARYVPHDAVSEPPSATFATTAHTGPTVPAVRVAAELARPSGVGLVGDGADGFVRAVITELVTRDGPRAKVVLSRAELDRLFGDAFDEPLRSALAPELHVCELLEDAIEHLELEMLLSDAEQANPDLSPTRGRGMPTTYWISTPGRDDDVVLPLVRRGPANRPVGIMFGVWPHGRTCAVDADGGLATPSGPRRVTPLTADQALAALRAHASTERTGWL
ncbi:hypothetical protein [Actinomadura gamaensis]|uniref:Type VII secretion protein EccE n=1 Tax=Actinomadura gamaensis TaxID=1763541 RepID=A0ABV9TQ17_9ACTN